MRERPILFSAPMVRAVLRKANPKTQTRRGIARLAGFSQKITEFGPSDTCGYDWHFRDREMRWHDMRTADLLKLCPYGQPGDRLWGKETFAVYGDANKYVIHYRATHQNEGSGWTPSIHMKRIYSRILLEVVSVRVERLQDISE